MREPSGMIDVDFGEPLGNMAFVENEGLGSRISVCCRSVE